MESKVTNVNLKLPYVQPRVRLFYALVALVSFVRFELSIDNKYCN